MREWSRKRDDERRDLEAVREAVRLGDDGGAGTAAREVFAELRQRIAKKCDPVWMERLVFTPTAREDLLSIAVYIAEDNPDRAETFVAELEAKAAEILERPDSFPERDDISPACVQPFIAAI